MNYSIPKDSVNFYNGNFLFLFFFEIFYFLPCFFIEYVVFDLRKSHVKKL
jgi:hypothetical protein